MLSPILFAIYIDSVSTLSTPLYGKFVFVYASDIILLALLLTELEKLSRAC